MTDIKPFTPDPNWPAWKLKVEQKKYQEYLESVTAASETPDYSEFADMVPNVNDDDGQKAEVVMDRQTFIDRISILDLYTKLTGNIAKRGSGQDNGIMGFCVATDHDNNNTEAMQMKASDNTFICHGCEQGGGVLAMTAFSMGIKNTAKGQLRGSDFAKAEEKLLTMYGWEFEKKNGETVAKSPSQLLMERKAAKENEEDLQQALKKESTPAPAEKKETGDTNVISITRSTDDVTVASALPTFDWEKVTTPDTALWHYMQACKINAVPEEYHFFNAMMIVGLTAGRNVCGSLGDRWYANVSPILIGHSGMGKSLSWKPLMQVLNTVLPFTCLPSGLHAGATIAHGPGSGEEVYDVFSKASDKNGKEVKGLSEVRGVVVYGEVSHFVNKASGRNSVLESAIQNLYDGFVPSGARSRSGGKSEVKDPFFCLISTSQPKVIGKTFTTGQVANGLAGRLDFVTGKYKEPDPFQTEVGDLSTAILHYDALRDWANTRERYLGWSDEARVLYSEFFDSKIRKIRRDPDSDIDKRIDLKIKKYALVFAINEMHEQIERSDLEKAIYLFDYVTGVLDFIGGAIGKSSRNEMSEEIFQFIIEHYKKNNKSCGMRDLKRKFKPKHPEWEDADYITTIKNLKELGEIVIEQTKPTRGFPKDTYTPSAEAL